MVEVWDRCNPSPNDYSISRDFESGGDESIRSTKALFLDVACGTYAARVDVAEFEIVYAELLANVINHSPGPFRVAVHAEPFGRVLLEVCDTGEAFRLSPTLPIDPYSTTGRGLYIVSRLCDEIKLTRTSRGNKISVVLRASGDAAPASKKKLREIPYHLFCRFRCLVRR